MNTPQTATLLIGSAKPIGDSTSEALGGYLMQRLADYGLTGETHHVARAVRSEARTAGLLAAVDRSDLFVLAFPLYVDSLPYLTVQALERIAAHRQAQENARPVRFVAIANCGFPEAHHNDTALAICRQFAAAAGLEWTGGLSMGAGTPFGGKPLEEAGGMARGVIAALDLTATALAKGDTVPDEAVAIMAKPFMPIRGYTLMGGMGWRMEGWRNGVYRQLRARPFANQSD